MKRWLVPSFLIHTCLWKSHSNGIIFCHISQHEELTLEDTIIAFSHTDQNKTRQDHLTDQCLLLCWYNGIQGSLQGIYCKRVFLSFCQHIFNDVTGHKQNSIIRALSVTLVMWLSMWRKWRIYIQRQERHLMALSPCFISPVSSSQETSKILIISVVFNSHLLIIGLLYFFHTWRKAGLFLSQPGRVKPWEQL